MDQLQDDLNQLAKLEPMPSGAPLFHRESQTFRRKVDVPDIEQYVWLDGADEPYAPYQPEQEAVCKFLRGKHGIETTDQD